MVSFSLSSLKFFLLIISFNNGSFDATRESADGKVTFGRLINHIHSDDNPNVNSKLIVVDGKPVIYFVAAQDIDNLEEELGYDYRDDNESNWLVFNWLAPKKRQAEFAQKALTMGVSQLETGTQNESQNHRITQEFSE